MEDGEIEGHDYIFPRLLFREQVCTVLQSDLLFPANPMADEDGLYAISIPFHVDYYCIGTKNESEPTKLLNCSCFRCLSFDEVERRQQRCRKPSGQSERDKGSLTESSIETATSKRRQQRCRRQLKETERHKKISPNRQRGVRHTIMDTAAKI